MWTAANKELDLARYAFVAAHARFQDAQGRRDVSAWYASLGETLWWIAALDEQYCNLAGPLYEELRDGDEHGRVIRGLRLARNRAAHRLALLLDDPRDGQGDGLLLEQLRWRQLEELPPPTRKSSESQERAYRNYLEGQAARYSLRRANYFFIRRREQLDGAFGHRQQQQS